MAIWQVDFNLVRICSEGLNISEDNIDRIISWEGFEVDNNSLKNLSKVLPLGKSWSESIIVYGDNEGTCCEFLLKNNNLSEVFVRIDLRTITEKLIDDILVFTCSNNAKILCNYCIYPATKDSIKKLIIESDAYAFLKNPSLYLKNIENNV